MDQEITYRMVRADASFRRLQERLWENRQISICVKCKVYLIGRVLSSLLYKAETWTFDKGQVDKRHAYMMRQLQQIMNITLFDKIRNKDTLWYAGLPPMMVTLIDKNLHWLGHVNRMNSNKLCRQNLLLPAKQWGRKNMEDLG